MDNLRNVSMDNFGRMRNDTGMTQGWSPTSDVGMNTRPQMEIHQYRALQGSIPVVVVWFFGVLRRVEEVPSAAQPTVTQ